MATDKDPLDNLRDAQNQSRAHRQHAGELFAAHAREDDPGRQRALLEEAKQENEKADGFDKKAEKLLARFSPGREGEAETAQKDAYTDRRSWYLPGSVAQDKLLQVEEANQGSLAGNLMKYAGRSLVERDGAAVTWAKEKAKAVVARFGRSPDASPARDKAHDKPRGMEKA